jgi:hypothetical protein
MATNVTRAPFFFFFTFRGILILSHLWSFSFEEKTSRTSLTVSTSNAICWNGRGGGVYFIDWSIAAKRTGRRLRFNGITTAIVSGTINQKKTKQKSPKRSATAGATGQHETCCFAHDPGVVFEGDWNERPVATFRQLSPALLLTSILLIDRSLIFRLVVKLDQIIAHRKMGPRRLLPLGQILFDRYTPFFIFPPPP